MKVLSLFDGLACGAIAFTKMGIPIERYVAYEIDKYAIQAATHNFPFIEERGDVFKADFTEFSGFDWVIGGSPCTYWSIAQKNNRETEASGLGWELFSQYVRAVREAKPKYFLYENNKSMSKEIKASITEAFGFEAVGINSALVSAQNRQRLYWVGKRNDDGTYSKVDVKQPEDKGILLRDVLDSAVAWQEKSYALTTRCMGAIPEDTLKKHRHTMVAEPLSTATGEKAFCIDASYYKGANPAYSLEKHKRQLVAEPVCVAQRGRYADNNEIVQRYEPREDSKTNAITTVQKDNAVCEPVCIQEQVLGRKANSDGTYTRVYEAREDGKSGTLTGTMRQNAIAEPVRVGDLPNSEGHINGSQAMRIYTINGKSVNLVAGGGGMGGKTGLYAVPSDGKTQPVYQVLNGLITIKDKQYPIKLADGYYIIRKLTVSECKRLQTVPEWYDFSVISNSQAYKCLGNAWTVDVIVHLIESAVNT